MPSFDCGGGRCGEFSCASCWDDATRKEYWALFSTGAAKSDAEARRIMTARINDREALARSAPSLRSDVARLTAEVEAMRAVVSTIEAIAEYDCTYGDDCPAFGARHGPCVGCKARRALDALRARKMGG